MPDKDIHPGTGWAETELDALTGGAARRAEAGAKACADGNDPGAGPIGPPVKVKGFGGSAMARASRLALLVPVSHAALFLAILLLAGCHRAPEPAVGRCSAALVAPEGNGAVAR
jgi:hypothetical protein